MSEYAHKPGGSLKFKGEGEKKKKKKTHSTTEKLAKVDADLSQKVREKEVDIEEQPRRAGDTVVITPSGRKMTEAEKRFIETQKKRREERVAKTASMTHKDRVSEFNSKLDKLSEHHDIPKISWTG